MHDPHRTTGTASAAGAAAPLSDVGDLFEGRPLPRLIVPPLRRQTAVGRRAWLFVFASWLPLLVLATVQGQGRSLLHDLGTFARYGVAGPLLLIGEAGCLAVLGTVAGRLLDLLPTADAQARYATVVGSVRRLLGHPMADLAVLVLAYALAAALAQAVTLSNLPAWFRSGGGSLSLAGWWHALVSLPLLLVLALGWLWRLLMWGRFLLLVSRLDLCLVAVHPDRSAGIGFVANSLAGFGPVAAALGAVVAGAVGNEVVHGGSSLAAHQGTIVGVVVVTIVLFTAPLLLLSPRLLQLWRSGTQQYDELSSMVGRQFEQEWFGPQRPPAQRDVLERSDFSAVADLYAVAERARSMRVVPVRLPGIAMLAIATLLPFVPVALLVVPFDTLLHALAGLLH